MVLASLVVLIVNLTFIVPLYFPSDASLLTTYPSPVRLLLMNVLSSNRDTEAVVAQIHRYQPDILVLEEITPRWFAALSDQLTDYPYQLHAVREDNFGIWLLSKFPVSDEEIIPWGPAQLPSATFCFRVGDQLARVVALHPMSPGDPQGVRWRNEQLRQIAARFQETDDPLLLVGDLNTTSFAPDFSRICARPSVNRQPTRVRVAVQLARFFVQPPDDYAGPLPGERGLESDSNARWVIT